jgi:hypothetical protein
LGAAVIDAERLLEHVERSDGDAGAHTGAQKERKKKKKVIGV